MQETKEQIEMYSMFRMIIYFTLVFEILVFTPLDNGPILGWLTRMLGKFFIFKTLTVCKITELVMVGITCIGTKARKDVKFNVKTMVFYPLLFGGTCILLCLLCHKGTWGGMLMGIPTNRCLYVLTSVLGIMAVHLGLDNISKYIRHKVGDDRFNFENESFKQETELEKNRYSVNIPMIYYFNGRMQHGWINVINPFRGTWVVGTPGSGKTFGVIEPFMRQHSEKGFSMVVYDYKFPTLAKKLFYLYCKNKTYGRTPRNCGFRIINFTDVEYSNRVNPIQAKYIDSLGQASETAATLLESLQKGGDKKGGSEQFFQNSAENFLAAIIYFFINFHPIGMKDGRKLQLMVVVNGKPLKVKVKGWRYYYAEDETGNVILDFHDIRGRNMALDENGALRKPEDWENMDFCSDHEGDFSSKRLNKCFIYGGKQVMWKKTDPADLDKDALYSPVYINDTVADISDDNTGKNYNSLTFTELLQLSSIALYNKEVGLVSGKVFYAEETVEDDFNGGHHTWVEREPYQFHVERAYYVDENGDEVKPDTYTGEYSDMPHVLSFLTQSYEDVFDVLIQDNEIKPLLAPFKSALDNQAMDQLEGMAGTLRVLASRLVTKEAYWVFSGDEFDLKVSDPDNPSYLVIANDPEMEGVVGALNALILNRLVTRVNSGFGKNVPVSIIVDELPTLYFHKIDRLIGTARSNKVAVTMGFQELPQLEADYGKVGMQKVLTTCGNVICGSARAKETLDWLSGDIFGKVKQIKKNMSIDKEGESSITLNEEMAEMVPAAKIADMPTGWLCGQTARDFRPTQKSQMKEMDIENSPEFKTTKFFCKTNFDMSKIKKEEEHYRDLPKFYKFASDKEKEIVLSKNFDRINNEIEYMLNQLLGLKINGKRDPRKKEVDE